jgi:hypothetical protein
MIMPYRSTCLVQAGEVHDDKVDFLYANGRFCIRVSPAAGNIVLASWIHLLIS